MIHTSNIIREGDDRIYYNVELKNTEATKISPTGLPYAEFKIDRTESLIDNPTDYYLTVARFFVPVQDTPIFMCPIDDTTYTSAIGGYTYPDDPGPYVPPLPPLINITPFSVTLSYGGNNYQQTLVYQTRTPNVTIPTIPGNIDVFEPYYYSIYTFSHFLRIVNQALEDAFTALRTAHPLITSTATQYPYFIYTPETELFSSIVPYPNVTDGIDIYLNDKLLTYLGNIEGIFYGRDLLDGLDFKFTITLDDNGYAKPGGIIPVPPLTPDYLQLKQEYKGLDALFSFSDLIIQSELPIVKEWTQTNDPTNRKPTSINLLTDFMPLLNEAGDSRSVIAYFVQGKYHLINMVSSTPLRSFSFKVFWKDKQGRLYPLTIPYRQTLSIKFLFIKKSTYAGG